MSSIRRGPNSPSIYSLEKTYATTLSLLKNEGMLNWQRANISLLGHSILILSWASIYAGKPNPQLLIIIPSLGIILCCLWYKAALAGQTYHNEWIAWQYYLEEQLYPAQISNIWCKHKELLEGERIEIGKEKIKLHESALGVSNYLKWLPWIFIAFYGVLWAVVLKPVISYIFCILAAAYR